MQLAALRLLKASGLFAALFLLACGGSKPIVDDTDAGPDAGSLLGTPCQFDSDCQPAGQPPNYICGVSGSCEASCLTLGCPSNRTCNNRTGRCDLSDGGTDGGTDGGADGGNTGPGTPSDTLCKSCTLNGDCHAGGLCVQDSTHTQNFCTQDCTDTNCPTGYVCTVDRTGTKHQCYPSSGSCGGSTGNDGGTTGGGDDGGTTDPNLPSNNPNGCGFCGTCNVNNDCSTDSICINGSCAVACDTTFGPLACILKGAVLASCKPGPNGTDTYCLPLLGACLPLPNPLGGDIGCVPSGANPNCPAGADLAPALGNNVTVVSGSPKLATDDSLALDSTGRRAIGYVAVDSNNNTYVAAAYSADGTTWSPADNGGKFPASTPTQLSPSLTVSKWSGGERMHATWVGYTLDTSNPQNPVAKNMFIEAAYSDNGGKTWTAGNVTTGIDTQSDSLQLDKPWIAAGPDGTLILTFTIGNSSKQHVFARVSTDHGASWGSSSVAMTDPNNDNSYGHSQAMPIFDPRDATGNTVFVAFLRYQQLAAGTQNSIQLIKSADKGKTWSTPVTISRADDQVLFDAPSVAIDKSGHLYVGYVAAPGSAGTPGSTYWDAVVATVDITGTNPAVTRQMRVNDDFPATQNAGCFQHFHTMVAVDQTSGAVYASWLDNRRQGGKGGLYYASSSDNGAHWSANKRVSSADFDFIPDTNSAQFKWLGDYFAILFDSGKLHFAWSDPRNGSSSQAFYATGTP
jgi:hypothetical protein